ncbi:cell wall-binding repeat-containing protein [Kineococcus esterisolvens]|uniref:cell wall-binding repeat-containing protein n=1 Tax=unclassified Kineococcus TaxID=2621656 RepID=UPI003D7C4648
MASRSERPSALRRAGAVAALVGLATVATAATAVATPTPVTAHRAYGVDRYATAATLEDPARDVAYVVTGTGFADGVTAGALAGHWGANIFLTPREQLTDDVRAVIGYYRKVVVVGSESAVGPDVVTWLRQNTRAELSRVGGADRYETAAKLSATSFAPGVADVIIATGTEYADALAGSAAAASVSSPVLVVEHGRIPDSVRAELARLQPGRITVLGGENAVSAPVAAELAQYTDGEVRRLAGGDRYETSVAVSRAYFPTGSSWVELASGSAWPDAIAAGASAGRRGSPVLLSPQHCLPQAVNLEIERLRPNSLQAVGGNSSYSEVAAKRTSCGAGEKKYLDEFEQPEGNATHVQSHATIGGVFYPRTAAFSTYVPTSTTDIRNAEYRVWDIGTGYSRFTAVAGVADAVTSGLTARVEVFGDERLLGSYDVAVGQPATIDVDVRGVRNLKLVTTSSGRTSTGDESDHVVYFGDSAVR